MLHFDVQKVKVRLHLWRIENLKFQAPNLRVLGVRCQVSGKRNQEAETLLFVICYLEFFVTLVLHYSIPHFPLSSMKNITKLSTNSAMN